MALSRHLQNKNALRSGFAGWFPFMTINDGSSFCWPGLLDKHRVSEDAFADAYAALADVERSWIKKNIAQLYALAPANPRERSSNASQWTSGLQTIVRIRPRDWAILLLAGSMSGPARTISAVLPAMTAGVKNILAVFPDQANHSPHMLVGLELCGLDMACALSVRKIKELFRCLAQSPAQGIVLDPDGFLSGLRLPDPLETMAVWRSAPPSRMGIWSEAADQWDWQTLLWNHPGLTFEVWGKTPNKMPASFKTISGDWKAFCMTDYRVQAIPTRLVQETQEFCSDLTLTPGQEGCWHWPDLHPNMFFHCQMVLQTSPDMHGESF